MDRGACVSAGVKGCGRGLQGWGWLVRRGGVGAEAGGFGEVGSALRAQRVCGGVTGALARWRVVPSSEDSRRQSFGQRRNTISFWDLKVSQGLGRLGGSIG